ncbi:UNVERIFIED_CONTAM: hypothetical protein NCL1_08730 [Trichonephila clavipes]
MIGVHKTLRLVPSSARLHGGIYQNVRNSIQRRCHTCQMTYDCNFEHLVTGSRFFNMSFGFFGPELMATLFQTNPKSEV